MKKRNLFYYLFSVGIYSLVFVLLQMFFLVEEVEARISLWDDIVYSHANDLYVDSFDNIYVAGNAGCCGFVQKYDLAGIGVGVGGGPTFTGNLGKVEEVVVDEYGNIYSSGNY